MSRALYSSVIYRLFFVAALFLRPARAEIYVTGTPAIIIAVIILLLFVGVCVAACFFVARRRKARKPQIFYPPVPPTQDEVPMLAPPASQGPFSDAAAVPANAYPYAQNAGGYAQNYAPNTSGYPQNTGYNGSPYPPAAHSTGNSSVSLGAYPQDGQHMNAPPVPNQNPFSPPPAPPPPVVRVV